MSHPVILFSPPVVVTTRSRPAPGRRGVFPPRRRFWLLAAVAILAALVCWPAPWHAAIRALLTWEAARQGCDLTIDAVEGGPFDAFELSGLHLRQRARPSAADPGAGTDLRLARVEIVPAWTLPGQGRREASWVRRLTLEGVRGRLDLSPGAPRPGGIVARLRWLRPGALAARLVPADFCLWVDDATLRRGRYRLRARGLCLTGSHDAAGELLAQTVEASGPGFDATLARRRGRTLWQGTGLTVSDLDLGHGLRLARATLDGRRLGRRRLDWTADLRALGGTVRGQGAVDLSRRRIVLEVGGSVQQVTLAPLARLLAVPGPADGLIEQASFSFRGDPEDWPAADLWLAGHATHFRWGERRWESLELQAVVTHRRLQVHRLELRQSRNRLSLDGECDLPPANPAAVAGPPGRWWQSGFACNVDARLEDLHDLAQLLGPAVPPVTGRMSVNGRLRTRPGAPGYDGYLNVEGSGLTIRSAPLDFLRSTLVFRGEELDVADLQATHDGDYLTGRGRLRLAGPTDFQARGRVSIKDTGVYAPAGADLRPWLETGGAPVRSLTAEVRLEGSVLYLDQCQGERDGGPFSLGGRVDLRDPARPVLDLALDGEQPPRAADPADAGALWRAGVSYRLSLRGPLTADGGPTVRGRVELVHGRFDRPEELAAPAVPRAWLETRLLQPLLRRLPEAWRDWPLDLRVTAADPLSGDASGRAGEIAPTWEVTGTGEHPRLNGTLEVRPAAGSASESQVWHFEPGERGRMAPSVQTPSAAPGSVRFFTWWVPGDQNTRPVARGEN